jgi:MraZ protein
MLLGKSYNSLDNQRRVTIPKHMRGQLGTSAVLTRGLDGGLFLLPEDYWQMLVNNLTQLPFTKKRARDFWRYLSNDAQSIQTDNLGRITIPATLAEFADLQKEVVVVGSMKYIEIWDQTRYHSYLDELSQHAEEIAEELPWEEGTHARTSINE